MQNNVTYKNLRPDGLFGRIVLKYSSSSLFHMMKNNLVCKVEIKPVCFYLNFIDMFLLCLKIYMINSVFFLQDTIFKPDI